MIRTPGLFFTALLVFASGPAMADGADAREAAVNTAWSGDALTATDGLDCEALRHARNAVYARHGYSFGDEWVAGQFKDDARYVRDAYVTAETIESLWTPNDKVNVELIVAAETAGDCMAYWKAKDKPEEVEASADEREFVVVEVWSGRLAGNGTLIEAFSAAPSVMIDRALQKQSIRDDWLAPLTCDELGRVIDAVYARNNFPFSDEETTTFFHSLSYDYRPNPNVTVANFSDLTAHRDDHTLLVTRRVAGEKSCKLEAPAAAEVVADNAG